MTEEHDPAAVRKSPAKAILITMATGFLLACGSFFTCSTVSSSRWASGRYMSDLDVGPYLLTSCVGLVIFAGGCVWALVAFFRGRL